MGPGGLLTTSLCSAISVTPFRVPITQMSPSFHLPNSFTFQNPSSFSFQILPILDNLASGKPLPTVLVPSNCLQTGWHQETVSLSFSGLFYSFSVSLHTDKHPVVSHCPHVFTLRGSPVRAHLSPFQIKAPSKRSAVMISFP